MSYKNTLQEYFQKRKQNLPVYDTYRDGGSAHSPLFVSKLTLDDGQVFNGTGQNKKKAELDAAILALQSLNLYNNTDKADESNTKSQKCTFNTKTAILLDLENIAGEVQKYKNLQYTNDIDIFGFVSSNHPLAKSDLEPIKKFVVKSDEADAADIALAVKFGQILFYGYQKHIIVTSDHFASSLPAITESISENDDQIEVLIVKCWGEFIRLTDIVIRDI